MNEPETILPSTPSGIRFSRERFTFLGTTKEYFGIWIVNILLTIVTLGIYSAWAKVRRQRYFYGNTYLAGSSFEYHARPVQILVGRIIVLVFIVAYNLALNFVPIVGGLVGLALLFAVPLFVARGLRFSARVTSYRNVRFDFTGTYWGAFHAFILGGAVVYGTMGILAPLASQWMWHYTLGNLRYGDRPVTCEPRLEKLYGQWWLPALLFIGGAIALIAVGIVAVILFSGGINDVIVKQDDQSNMVTILALIYGAFIPFALLYAMSGLLYRAGTRNVALNETLIDGRHLMASSIHRGRYLWIAVTNLVSTLATLGLLRPWAAIRMASYLASVTALDATGPLDVYSGSAHVEGSAVGAEYMDVEGFDFGF